jgi:putative SOS response-associated peptidase YedK
VRRRDQAPFAFAGLWEVWRTPLADPLESCTIVTTTPNALMQPIHHRAPVILDRADFTHWLGPEFRDTEALKHLLVPWAPDAFEAFPVSALVNNARHDVAECRQQPLHTSEQVSLFEGV